MYGHAAYIQSYSKMGNFLAGSGIASFSSWHLLHECISLFILIASTILRQKSETIRSQGI